MQGRRVRASCVHRLPVQHQLPPQRAQLGLSLGSQAGSTIRLVVLTHGWPLPEWALSAPARTISQLVGGHLDINRHLLRRLQ